jgi:hypothetical protein
MRFIPLWLAFAVSALLPAPAFAQEFTLPPEPVVIAADAELPPLPEGWETVRGPWVEVHGRSEELSTLLRLSRHAEEQLPQLAESLQVPLGTTIHVYLADSAERFRALQPGRAPAWADGVAYPELGLVLLRSPRIRGGTAEPLETVLRHELVHVLLGRAFAPERPPTWLQEGFAQVWAGEVGPETAHTLSQGAAAGTLMNVQGLSRGFPSDPVRARLAYAQSADLIGWLRDTYGDDALAVLVRELAHGAAIEGAVHTATGDLLEVVDRRWRGRLEGSNLAWGALANVDALFGVGALMLVVGGVARRRRFHRRLEEMAAEEAALDALIAGYVGNRRQQAS